MAHNDQSGTAGLPFPITPFSLNASSAAFTAFALAAVPGQTDSVIVSAGASQSAYSTITIYDSGVPRPNFITLFTSGICSLQADGTRNEVTLLQLHSLLTTPIPTARRDYHLKLQ